MPEALTRGKAARNVGLASGFLGVAGAGAAAAAFAEAAEHVGARTIARQEVFALLLVGESATVDQCVRVDGIACAAKGELYEAEGLVDQTTAARVAAAYAAGGARGWAGLDGAFAGALWDARSAELFLYRDPSAAEDLFWLDLGAGVVAFSNRLSHFSALVPAARLVAPQSLHEYLRFLDISPPNTILTGVLALEPGCLLRWRDGTILPPQPISSQPNLGSLVVPPSLREAADEFEVRLQDAVAARVPRAGGFAAFLSGGLDSTLLCAIARAQAEDRVEAVTVAFEDPAADESGNAARIANHLKVRHRVLHYSLDDYHDAFPVWISSLESPYADPAALPTFLAYRDVRCHHAVALDGTGADEVFGVMPPRHKRLAGQYPGALPYGLRLRAARLLDRLGPIARYRPMFDFGDPEELLIRWHGWERREIEALVAAPVSLAHTRFYRLYRSFPASAHFTRYSALYDAFPSDRVYQSAASTGLSVRLPFMAPRVQRYVRSLPLEFRYHPGEPKKLLRAILARHLPPALWDGPKHGFDFPLATFLRHRRCSLVREYVDHNKTDAQGRFVPAKVREYCDRFVAGDDRVTFKVWAYVVLQAWHGLCVSEGRLDGALWLPAPSTEGRVHGFS